MSQQNRVQIDLILIGEDQSNVPTWPLGQVWRVAPTPAALARLIQERLADSAADCWLFYDSSFALPDPQRIEAISQRPGDLWHAGLQLGMQQLPGLLDYVAPTWELGRDPANDIEATSWRVSLRACLVRTEVLKQLGGPRPEMSTLAGAALEFGQRAIKRGALTRHIPSLLAAPPNSKQDELPFVDELRLIYFGYGRRWAQWAVLRAVSTGYVANGAAIRAARQVLSQPPPPLPPPYRRQMVDVEMSAIRAARVTVLIPTIDRYPYLQTLLEQLREQTIKPHEIIIIDQTARARRDETILAPFSDLPLQVIYQDTPGQCTARNAGLQRATGDYVLFVDDDDEVKPDLIERHLKNLWHFRADVSSGVAEERDAGPLPADFRFTRISNVFPTNNTLIKRAVLRRSGLFDLAYDRGARADGDLGMRIYLSGALMILNAEITLFHHHAPAGGLRTHKARTVTYAASRQSVLRRQLPGVTELYLKRRYFTARQQREADILSLLGTFSVRGNFMRKALKALVSSACSLHSFWTIRKRNELAKGMTKTYPQIPELRQTEMADDLPGPTEATRTQKVFGFFV